MKPCVEKMGYVANDAPSKSEKLTKLALKYWLLLTMPDFQKL